ncbi:hypothetical protein [Sphingopyxis terrae]|uniref:hypothetical protein n=1 Tax=Sphingopyxis terrae TaxID=33052 RepID=UPI0036148FC3
MLQSTARPRCETAHERRGATRSREGRQAHRRRHLGCARRAGACASRSGDGGTFAASSQGAELRPLRELLGNYLALPAAARDDVSLILENGQAFRADDIDALLARPDSPFR